MPAMSDYLHRTDHVGIDPLIALQKYLRDQILVAGMLH
jgi:hypothetical protein